eukprot:2015880-Rhodomonas_salina.9
MRFLVFDFGVYEPTSRCPVLRYDDPAVRCLGTSVRLHVCYGMPSFCACYVTPGVHIARAVIGAPACYAMSGTEIP